MRRKKEKPLHNVLKQRLAMLGKSQGWLSRETGITINHVNKIVNGYYNPQLLSAKKIAKALNCMIDDLWLF